MGTRQYVQSAIIIGVLVAIHISNDYNNAMLQDDMDCDFVGPHPSKGYSTAATFSTTKVSKLRIVCLNDLFRKRRSVAASALLGPELVQWIYMMAVSFSAAKVSTI